MTGHIKRERRWCTAMSGWLRCFSTIQKAAKDAAVPASRARAVGDVQPAAEPSDTMYVKNTRNSERGPAPHQSMAPPYPSRPSGGHQAESAPFPRAKPSALSKVRTGKCQWFSA